MKKLLNMKLKKLIIIYLICLVVFVVGGGIVTATVIKPELEAVETTVKANMSESESKEEKQYESVNDKCHHDTKIDKHEKEYEKNKYDKKYVQFEMLDTTTRVVMIVLAGIAAVFVFVFLIILILVILKNVFKIITCPECQAITSKKYDYCSKCGSLLYKKCPNCDAKVSRKHIFCMHCGKKLNLSGNKATLDSGEEKSMY